jgi:hypothetical protein
MMTVAAGHFGGRLYGYLWRRHHPGYVIGAIPPDGLSDWRYLAKCCYIKYFDITNNSLYENSIPVIHHCVFYNQCACTGNN